jgi:hypothetical protein
VPELRYITVRFSVYKTTSELEHVTFTTLYLADAKNIDSWCARKGNLQRVFPMDVPMVPSFALTIATDGERLTCSGFSLGETIRLRSFEFVPDYVGGLSLSPRRSNIGAAFMVSTRSGSPSLRWAMIKDSTGGVPHGVKRGRGLRPPLA